MKRRAVTFAQKCGIAIAILSICVASVSVGYMYFQTRAIVIEEARNRLRDVTQTAAHLFGPEEREILKRHKERVLTLGARDPQVIEALLDTPGESYVPEVDPAVAPLIHASEDLQDLIQILRSVRAASSGEITPLRKYGQVWENTAQEPAVAFAYIFGAIPESPNNEVIIFLADLQPQDFDENEDGIIQPAEEGVLAGTLYSVSNRIFIDALNGRLAIADEWYRDRWGTFLSASIPILDTDGSVIATFGIDYAVGGVANRLRALAYISIGIIVVAILLSIALAAFIARFLNKPLKQLARGVENLRAKKFDSRINIATQDEFGRLSAAFNDMATEIGRYVRQEVATKDAYYRFVPREMLDHLGNDSLEQVQLGDQAQKIMAVLFSDIRGFTTITEKMSPKESINYLNQYLAGAAPVIRSHDGFIDKYIGDAIMALFPAGPSHAIRAAVRMHKITDAINAEHQLPVPNYSLKIGCGIHFGHLVVGTVGEEHRMDSTVISDVVNIASRLEELTKIFGVNILVSEGVIKEVREGDFNYRFIGKVRVRGRQQAIGTFEIFDEQESEIRDAKVASSALMSEAITAYTHGKFSDSLDLFNQILRDNARDTVASYYKSLCMKKV